MSLSDIRQAGAQGVVSALHHIAPGMVWGPEAIVTRLAEVEGPADQPTGLTWDVVESLPVSEAIKTAGPERAAHLEAYVASLHNPRRRGHPHDLLQLYAGVGLDPHGVEGAHDDRRLGLAL